MTAGPSEEAASRLFDRLSQVFPFLETEDAVVNRARGELQEQFPGAPVEWAIKQALGNTRHIMKELESPLSGFIRREVLANQLKRSDSYLGSLSKFLGLEESE